MKTKNIAAFPLKHSDDKFNPGMTLRDYFAGQAINILVPPTEYVGQEQTEKSFYFFANKAYKIADALLIERQKYESQNNG
jgi:hypothetical protein